MSTTGGAGSTALVTGASYGIGADIARALAARGHDLVLVARSAGPLGRLAAALETEYGITARPLTADLSTEAGLEAAAGAGLGLSFERTAWEEERRMLALNVVAPSRLVHAALPGMLGRGRGRILNVSSVAATAPVWLGTSYGASKAYALALTESLARTRRVRRSPVALTALVLGHTVSEFHERAGIPPSPPSLTLGSPYVAERAVRAILRRRPPVVCVPSVRYRVLAGLLGHLPHRIAALPPLADDFTVTSYGAPQPSYGTGEPPAGGPESAGGDGQDGVLPAEAHGQRERQP
ncbi:SDR family NAD(P)-dependent oxidoreductase [Streptomyces sp. me109]|uniref:SDR family NAD(P)-dependent oxidoreductase n=1 Tax=Streptomyces sp. me109 TaxID=1827853 RepID=UPI0011CECF2B|nr:SDR family NAD(P)-dependent oxidoreductase [Streptomyces sp. me109]TXS76920.1 SDR family NAD(P)-dependent oxidoreductase [Streptomyces sp. me109]